MRHLLTILAALLLCASPAAAQTMKALMYGTNGNVIAPNIAFTNQVSVLGVNIASGGMIQYNGNDIYDMSANSFVGAVNFDSPASTRANLGFSTNLNTLWTATNSSNARSAIGLGATWLTNTNVTNFRTAIGLPLAALTNTSNVTVMRALAGATNTNMPLSGTMIIDPANTYEMVVSNGIILDFYVQ